MDELISEAQDYFSCLRKYVNVKCSSLDSFDTIAYSVLLTWVISYLYHSFSTYNIKSLKRRVKEYIFSQARRIPFIRKKVDNELGKVRHDLQEQMMGHLGNAEFLHELPEKGWTKDQIKKEVDKYLSIGKVNWKKGLVSGAVYKSQDPVLESLVEEVYGVMAYTNPLHPDIFPGLRKMESEIVRMVCSLYNGDSASCGTVTTGGTESILLACKAYRDYAIAERGIDHPEMVIPITAHAAFDKAAQILNIKVIHVPVHPDTMQVNIKAMKRVISKRTCMLVGSTPQFPHGAVDPISEIAKLGLYYNIPVHVDSCLGGFLVPFMKSAGFYLPPSDFSVPGVTSISADMHKYGYAPKGTSVIMYSDIKYRHHQFSVQPDWPGGIYVTPTIGGSRAGGIIGACWASLMYYGLEGYIEETRKIIKATKFIEKELRATEGLIVIGKPEVSVVALGSNHFDIYCLNQKLVSKGWNLNVLQFPNGFHMCITQLHTKEGVAELFVREVRECVSELLKAPRTKPTGAAAIYGMSQGIPDRSFVSEAAWAFMDACYSTEVNVK